ncbi:MAG: hypothetical protein K2H52_06280 [Lachnospiraceae bacterium]|nr:hypothetical protein [Lachnospiraceae bacterium]
MENVEWRKYFYYKSYVEKGDIKMTHNCKIVNIDEEEVTLRIGDIYITGFANCGINKKIGEETMVDISLYDDLKIMQYSEDKFCIERKDKTFKYTLFGILDVENAILKSVIDFKIDEEELFDYGYLDGMQVKIEVLRIDFDFQ